MAYIRNYERFRRAVLEISHSQNVASGGGREGGGGYPLHTYMLPGDA